MPFLIVFIINPFDCEVAFHRVLENFASISFHSHHNILVDVLEKNKFCTFKKIIVAKLDFQRSFSLVYLYAQHPYFKSQVAKLDNTFLMNSFSQIQMKLVAYIFLNNDFTHVYINIA